MKTATAWIFRITPSISAAVGELELVHLLPEHPILYAVPQAPHYCRHVMVWRQKIVPVMNLAARLQTAAGRGETATTPTPDTHQRLGIFAYRDDAAKPAYGALFLASLPRRYAVSDAQMCRLPADFTTWTPYVMSCFQDRTAEQAIPILNLNRVFSAAFQPSP